MAKAGNEFGAERYPRHRGRDPAAESSAPSGGHGWSSSGRRCGRWSHPSSSSPASSPSCPGSACGGSFRTRFASSSSPALPLLRSGLRSTPSGSVPRRGQPRSLRVEQATGMLHRPATAFTDTHRRRRSRSRGAGAVARAPRAAARLARHAEGRPPVARPRPPRSMGRPLPRGPRLRRRLRRMRGRSGSTSSPKPSAAASRWRPPSPGSTPG